MAALLPPAEVTTVDGDDHLLRLRSTPALARLVADHAARATAAGTVASR